MQALIQESYGLWLALTVASSFICTWVYTHTGGSVLIGALAAIDSNRTAR